MVTLADPPHLSSASSNCGSPCSRYPGRTPEPDDSLQLLLRLSPQDPNLEGWRRRRLPALAWWFDWVEDDDRLTRLAPPTTSRARAVVRVNSSMLALVPGPADFEAIEETISAYPTSQTLLTAATIGIVACPPHDVMFTFGEARAMSTVTVGTANGPTAAGVRSTARMRRCRVKRGVDPANFG